MGDDKQPPQRKREAASEGCCLAPRAANRTAGSHGGATAWQRPASRARTGQAARRGRARGRARAASGIGRRVDIRLTESSVSRGSCEVPGGVRNSEAPAPRGRFRSSPPLPPVGEAPCVRHRWEEQPVLARPSRRCGLPTGRTWPSRRGRLRDQPSSRSPPCRPTSSSPSARPPTPFPVRVGDLRSTMPRRPRPCRRISS